MTRVFSGFYGILQLDKAFKNFKFEPTDFNISIAQIALSKSLEQIVSNTTSISAIDYSGWISSSLRFDLDKATLEKLNPNYRVTIRRIIRKELLRGFRIHGLRPGFVVSFIPLRGVDTTSAVPILAINNEDNLPILPTGSSRNSKFVIRKMQAQTYQGTSSKNTRVDVPFYLDKTQISLSGYSKVENWILTNLDSVIDLLRYLKEPECAKRLLELLPQNQLLTREFEKIEFLINGTSSVGNEEFEILEIDRHLSNLDQRSAQPFVKPLKNKHTVRFVKTQIDLSVPKIGFTEVKSVIVFEGCQVKQNNSLFLIENAADPVRDFVSGQWSYFFGGNAQPDAVLLDREPYESVDVQSGILLGGRNENNWYHWVIEYVSRLNFDTEIPPEIPILVSDTVPESFLEVISSFSDREILRLPKTMDWKVETLFVAQPLMQILDSTVIPWEEGLFLNSAALGAFRDTVLHSQNSYPSPSKIFLTRNSGHRGLINQRKLRKLAESFGFTSIDPSSMSWSQQVNLFRNANMVVGASGAVMANYLFMPPNSKIHSLTNERLWDFVLPAQISSIAGVNFSYLLGKSKFRMNKTSVENMHSDFRVSPKRFKATLKQLDIPPR